MTNHTQFCEDNGYPCQDQRVDIVFNQPSSTAVGEASMEFDEGTPWCIIHERAVEIDRHDNGETGDDA
ncbi:hypothetical protein VST63_19200 [Mycolicibacterium sp. 050232]|uniref:hypothetical protein n=1 Tax=Mycolicibacterium sp. 050232 TaxID=3113982 RepID=UPI002E28FF8A|nr:hypothetical protein [Mycolicibacterium sp. 050232]MED5814489.1 hypothetical protein [Mycolicibacterium sp. 050232]